MNMSHKEQREGMQVMQEGRIITYNYGDLS